MILSFRSREAELVFRRGGSLRLPQNIQQLALRKLQMLHRSRSLWDLRNPPGNHLERLWGDREGQYSIRINRQWRICFRWVDGDVYDVDIVDYH